MKISILNSPDKDFNHYVELCVEFCMDKLVSKRISRNVIIVVKFDDKIDVHGYTSVVECNSNKKPREFLLEINPYLGSRGILNTVAHEMVHVGQHIDGKIDDELRTWEGKLVPEDTDYWDEPWEIDAYGRQPGLMTNFAKKHQLWNVFGDIRNPDFGVENRKIRWK
jgi:hypothetical protein